ncbi:MAG: ATP-binding protein [Gemmatimonadota bacterium]
MKPGKPGILEFRDAAGPFNPMALLRWIYLGRVTLATGILVGALLVWGEAQPEQTFVATILFAMALLASGASAWYTHLLERTPGKNFLYSQAVFDAVMVTGIIHITGGGDSNFAWLYILVISAGALLLPFAGGVLVGALAIILFFADIIWGHSETLSGSVMLQMGLFALVAILTGLLGDRLRRAGTALGAVRSQLRRLQLDTSDILASLSTGVLTVDGDGHLLYLNPAGEALLGMESRQWDGSPVLDAVQEAAPGLGALLSRSLDQAQGLSRYKIIVRRDDAEVTLGISTTVRAGEEGTAVTALFQDITDLERMDEVKRRNERLEAVAELSASMAHEIKNPLASIRSAVEQLTRSSLDDGDREVLRKLVVTESQRLSRILSDFIEFSRVQVKELEELSVCELLREAVGLAEQHPDASGVKLTLTGDQSDFWIKGDADLLHRAFFNLILNGVQFAGEGGWVRVEVGRPPPLGLGLGGLVGGEFPTPSATIQIRVSDSGPGVPEADLGRVFDPFYTTRKGGSGLGLALVHRAVEAHKGMILPGRAPEGGAQFTLLLPGATGQE